MDHTRLQLPLLRTVIENRGRVLVRVDTASSSQKVNWQKDQNPGLLVILLLGILSVHHQQLLPVEEGDVHVPHQHPFRHSALGSSEPRHLLLTELILCVLAVILHKTVVFDRKNNSSLLCWGQWQPGIKVVVVVVIRLV